ncbi:MAG: 30S ribosomal protein S6 [Desulfobacterium sp.]|nr:30S ribosomal protein S6 [Desulfobacterium sp.]
MRMYETIFIADPDLQDEGRSTLFEKFKGILGQEGGILANFDDWGNKKLAYEIARKSRGHYVCMTYGGTGPLVSELERTFRLDDKILKYMTILLEKDVDPEALQLQIDAEATARTEAEAAKAKAEAEAEAAQAQKEAQTSEAAKVAETVEPVTQEDEEEEN